ncbi:MAG: hypothetical protein MHPSP_002737, partial [Paramarteilia canceri]
NKDQNRNNNEIKASVEAANSVTSTVTRENEDIIQSVQNKDNSSVEGSKKDEYFTNIGQTKNTNQNGRNDQTNLISSVLDVEQTENNDLAVNNVNKQSVEKSCVLENFHNTGSIIDKDLDNNSDKIGKNKQNSNIRQNKDIQHSQNVDDEFLDMDQFSKKQENSHHVTSDDCNNILFNQNFRFFF